MDKITVTKQQRANALEALNIMWPSVPEENVVPALLRWASAGYGHDVSVTTCGTVACFGGWVSRYPAFIAQGAGQDAGWPSLNGRATSGCRNNELALRLFGDSALFDTRKAREGSGADHAIVAKRLRDLIKNSRIEA